ncbi:DASH family cryptochrome [Halapricum hydrolyticum]|uniref:Cryptochrome DASH n=1 Tax=Halapricum hydrolyticum TaxID=2979991 RepID=A0AAE3LFR8_9EURY|nr:DASH family cryptochrome [Halapricum hydrolyticum]MCU4718955.1 DASH family cryptochrome [Halapricum hydrolyticum]MCU4727952.1 DASH family cryptochrome [Halapricum hydrolyticum]
MTETALVWFRRDLRVHDNPTLRQATAENDCVVPLYTFDTRQFGQSSRWIDERRVGTLRAQFVRESVRDLRERLNDRGGSLLVRRGDPRSVLPEAAESVDADVVHAQRLPVPEERETEAAVGDALDSRGIDLATHWTHTLHAIEDLPMAVENVQDTFTPWKDSVEANSQVRDPLGPPASVPTPDLEGTPIPTLAELGDDEPDQPADDSPMPVSGGESAALERLQTYIFERDRLREYRETRNGLLGMDFSSKFSPWLAQGCLSPRRVKQAVDRYESERVANDSTYWLLFELRWRDFFQFQFAKHGEAYFRSGGIQSREVAWNRDETAFRRWTDGETGFPFVDAAMRELRATGYQSNRARQNAASFLANTLRIDWRWGAAYYESRLLDYDVASNYGNWAYVAGVGTDSRDRAFDVLWQAHNYDPDAEYVRRWVPELSKLPPRYAHEPWRMDIDEQARYGVELGVDYPEPMVDPTAHFEGPSS